MGEIAKGFGLYGNSSASDRNSKGSYVWFNAFAAKTPPGAAQICIPSISSYAGTVAPGLTGFSWTNLNQMSFYTQAPAGSLRTFDYALLGVSASPASGSITGATLNFGTVPIISTTTNNITLDDGPHTIDPIPTNGGSEYIEYQKILLNYTPGPSRVVVPYVVLPASPAPVSFNFVLTIYFSSDLV